MNDPEVSKSQRMRLLDVLVLGPFMVGYASKKKHPKWARLFMAGFGIGTIVYNFLNYEATERLRR